MRFRHNFPCLFFVLLFSTFASNAQQISDTEYRPPITKAAYTTGQGPFVLLDEAHFNFHTATGRYLTFAELLRRDGYVVQSSTTKFSRDTLQKAKILVIANALNERNANDWTLPTPSAFTDEEIAAVRTWVNNGGSLLLIADHMPFPGAAEKLGAAFGINFTNGYVRNEKSQGGPDVFRRNNANLQGAREMRVANTDPPDAFQRIAGSLEDHPITNGRNSKEQVESVATFTGSAFQVANAQPLLRLSDAFVSVLTTRAGQITATTPRVSVNGWLQGAVFKFGKGRVAVFGEAAMFSAQLAGPNRNPMGMNAPQAKQNYQFLLNVMHWLSGRLP